MIQEQKYPIPNVALLIQTKYGERLAHYDEANWRYLYDDCTNPLQNIYCHPHNVISWKYKTVDI